MAFSAYKGRGERLTLKWRRRLGMAPSASAAGTEKSVKRERSKARNGLSKHKVHINGRRAGGREH
eukprot:1157848-Pelagomonas_calceolata.AAC.1